MEECTQMLLGKCNKWGIKVGTSDWCHLRGWQLGQNIMIGSKVADYYFLEGISHLNIVIAQCIEDNSGPKIMWF